MRKKFNAKLVPMELTGSLPSNSILECIKPIAGHRKGVIIIGGQWDGDDNIWWQAQRLIITNEHGTALASYPNIPDTHCIDLSDIRRWIQSGCPDSVELEVTEYFSTDKVFAHTGGSPMAISLRITNNTVKMVWGEQDKAQPIAGEVKEIEPPIGDFILKQKDIKPLMREDGAYYHYVDVCRLLKRHHPATDWDALEGKFKDTHCVRNGIGLDITDTIFNFFKNELNK